MNKITRSKSIIPLNDEATVDDEGNVVYSGVSLMNPTVCSAILCNYSRLKQDSWEDFEGDTWYLIYDFERTCDKALKSYPLY